MKNYISVTLLLFVLISCKTRENEKLNEFLTEWSFALKANDESVQQFYDASFEFPKHAFKPTEGISFALDIEHATVAQLEGKDDFKVTVPFQIASPDKPLYQATIDLTIAKTETGFIIRQMTQELAMELMGRRFHREYEAHEKELKLHYDSLLGGIRSMAKNLRRHYDSIVFYTEINGQTLFYVVNGNWNYPYDYEPANQHDGGNYKMGVVTSDNKVIVPVEYTKIYNPDGSFKGMIEVENNGVRGLFRTNGEVFLPAQFEGIYPTTVPGAFAQLKKGESYGWVSPTGEVSFDPSSHENKTLFQSPIETNAVLDWKFGFPGAIKLLIDPHTEGFDMNGVIVYPSYIRDMGVTAIGNGSVFLETSEYGMGMTDTEIKFEKVESISDKFFALVSFFMEAGGDARSYHTAKNDLLVVDKNMKSLTTPQELTVNYHNQDPCGGAAPTYRTIEPGLYESNDGNGVYVYYKITPEGKVEQLKTNRRFNYTKFVKIDERYFNFCRYQSLDYEEGKPNVVVSQGVSFDDLDLMRNEIFAEYGFKFKTPKWKKYFEAQPWYKPQFDNVDHLLNETDKANIKFIQEFQRLHKDLQVQRDSISFGWAG